MSNVASRVRCSLFLLPLLLAPGCAAFRAQVGLGFGVGADVQVLGLQHVGVLLGKYHEWGPNYGRGTYSKTGYTVLGPYHSTHMTFDEDEVTGTTRPPIEHGCYGFFPGPAGLLSDEPAAERWALEFGVAMTFVELRFGFNPVAPIFNVEEQPAGPRPAPAPTPAPRPTQPAAAEGPTASSGAPTHEPGQRTYGGEARETAAPPPPPPPPPPPAPPPGKQAPPAPANEAPSAAESASQDVRLPDPPSEEHEEAPAEVQEEAPPAPAPSDQR